MKRIAIFHQPGISPELYKGYQAIPRTAYATPCWDDVFMMSPQWKKRNRWSSHPSKEKLSLKMTLSSALKRG